MSDAIPVDDPDDARRVLAAAVYIRDNVDAEECWVEKPNDAFRAVFRFDLLGDPTAVEYSDDKKEFLADLTDDIAESMAAADGCYDISAPDEEATVTVTFDAADELPESSVTEHPSDVGGGGGVAGDVDDFEGTPVSVYDADTNTYSAGTGNISPVDTGIMDFSFTQKGATRSDADIDSRLVGKHTITVETGDREMFCPGDASPPLDSPVTYGSDDVDIHWNGSIPHVEVGDEMVPIREMNDIGVLSDSLDVSDGSFVVPSTDGPDDVYVGERETHLRWLVQSHAEGWVVDEDVPTVLDQYEYMLPEDFIVTETTMTRDPVDLASELSITGMFADSDEEYTVSTTVNIR